MTKINIESLIHDSSKKYMLSDISDNTDIGWHNQRLGKLKHSASPKNVVHFRNKKNKKGKKGANKKYKECVSDKNHRKSTEIRNNVNSRDHEIKKEYWQKISNEMERDF